MTWIICNWIRTPDWEQKMIQGFFCSQNPFYWINRLIRDWFRTILDQLRVRLTLKSVQSGPPKVSHLGLISCSPANAARSTSKCTVWTTKSFIFGTNFKLQQMQHNSKIPKMKCPQIVLDVINKSCLNPRLCLRTKYCTYGGLDCTLFYFVILHF